MLSELFINYDFWYSIALLCFVTILCILVCRTETGKYIFVTALMLVAVGTATYSGIQLMGYYGSVGGIYGSIFGVETPEVVTKEMVFDFKNMELIESENEGEYVATIETNDVFKMDLDKTYCVYVNETPCGEIDYSKDYIIAEYTYNFYNNNKDCIMSDKLIFNISFYTNKTTFEIKTKNGFDAVKYWNSYFNKNVFVVEIKAVSDVYIADSELSIIQEQAPEIAINDNNN